MLIRHNHLFFPGGRERREREERERERGRGRGEGEGRGERERESHTLGVHAIQQTCVFSLDFVVDCVEELRWKVFSVVSLMLIPNKLLFR